MHRMGRLSSCVAPGCDDRVAMVVEIALPAEWTAEAEYMALAVRVGACRLHGAELRRRVRALQEARCAYPVLLAAADDAVTARAAVASLEDELAEAAGAALFAHERAADVELALAARFPLDDTARLTSASRATA
jgi:hypothetical protein